jgi:phage FluMu protein Com
MRKIACRDCGKIITPTSSRQLRCPECKTVAKTAYNRQYCSKYRDKWSEYGRRSYLKNKEKIIEKQRARLERKFQQEWPTGPESLNG